MLSVKQGIIKYHFLSLWYDSTWDWTQVSRAIGEHSNIYEYNAVCIYWFIYWFIRSFIAVVEKNYSQMHFFKDKENNLSRWSILKKSGIPVSSNSYFSLVTQRSFPNFYLNYSGMESTFMVSGIAKRKIAFLMQNVFYISIKLQDLRGFFKKVPDFFRMGNFIDKTHIKLKTPLK